MAIGIELSEANITSRQFTGFVRGNRRRMVHRNNQASALELLAVSNAFGGEAGELQNVVKKIIRDGVLLVDHPLHDDFVLEAGDAIHYLFSLIDLAGYSPEYIMACNVRKLEERKQAKLEAQQEAVLATIAPEPRT
jgi:hypothetical protein